MKKLLLIYLLFPALLFAQDTTLTVDDLFTNDSLVITNNYPGIADSLKADSLQADSTQSKAIADTLKPLFYSGLNSGTGTNITHKTCRHYDYRYTADIVKHVPFGFLNSFGIPGMPDEMTLYGRGFNNISYMRNGVPVNGRLNNSYDLHNYQSENLDSLEYIPLVRGFLYGSYNNPVSVNAVTKDRLSPVPYTYVRFYQANNDEGYVNAQINMYLGKKIYFTGGAANISVQPLNESEIGGWRANAKLHYLFSSELNFIFEYNYSSLRTDLTGGIDVKLLEEEYGQNFTTDLIFEETSPNLFDDRYQKSTLHNLRFNAIADILGIKSDLALYYISDLNEYRQGTESSSTPFPVIFENNGYEVSGVNIRQNLSVEYFNLDFYYGYERTATEADILKNDLNMNTYFASGKLTLNLPGNIKPSGFMKYLNYNSNDYSGIGADVKAGLLNNLSLYGGFSFFEKPYNLLEQQYLQGTSSKGSEVSSFEVKAEYQYRKINLSAGIFTVEEKRSAFPVIAETDSIKEFHSTGFYQTRDKSSRGVNLNISAEWWKILVKTNFSYYFQSEYEDYNLPEFTAFAGIYYVDTLFNDNLNLKAGFNFYANGQKFYSEYDFRHMQQNFFIQRAGLTSMDYIRTEFTDFSFNADFFMAARIRQSAVFYLVFENLLPRNYYIVPYYPSTYSGIKIGISWEFFN